MGDGFVRRQLLLHLCIDRRHLVHRDQPGINDRAFAHLPPTVTRRVNCTSGAGAVRNTRCC